MVKTKILENVTFMIAAKGKLRYDSDRYAYIILVYNSKGDLKQLKNYWRVERRDENTTTFEEVPKSDIILH